MSVTPKLELVNVRLNYAAAGQVESDLQTLTHEAVNLEGSHGAPPIRIYPGEFTVLLGPSGCGKSSLLRMVAGLITPSSGAILKDGRPVTGPGNDRVMVFQAYTSFPWLTVEENLLFALDLESNGGDSQNAARSKRDRAKEMLEFVDLADSAHKFPRELSGGMKQRVAIARALVCNPDILLMDEPFGALDPHIRVKMQELMLRIGQAVKTTVIFVTHDAREAVFLGDVIYISTVRPCFLKYRILHPFDKTKIDREKARDRYSGEFLRFQREVEDRMQFLIEHPETPRLAEKEDDTSFQRSTLGVLEQLSDEAEL